LPPRAQQADRRERDHECPDAAEGEDAEPGRIHPALSRQAVAVRVARLAALAGGALVSACALAQSWPTKPIHLMLGYTTGGAADAMARPLIAKMEPALGQPLVDRKSVV